MCAHYEILTKTNRGKLYEITQEKEDGSTVTKYQVDFGNMLMTLHYKNIVLLNNFILSIYETGVDNAKVQPNNKILIQPKGFIGYYALTEDELLELRELITVGLDYIKIGLEIKKLMGNERKYFN